MNGMSIWRRGRRRWWKKEEVGGEEVIEERGREGCCEKEEVERDKAGERQKVYEGAKE